MAEAARASGESQIPHELTAPPIQRLARKGIAGPLTEAERAELCACVVFHIERILKERRIPKTP